MNTKIVVGQKWKTRNGLVATITNTDGLAPYRFRATFEDGSTVSLTENVRQFDGTDGPLDLMELVEGECDCAMCSGELPPELAEIIGGIPKMLEKKLAEQAAKRAEEEAREFADEMISSLAQTFVQEHREAGELMDFVQVIIERRKSLKF